LKDNDYKKLKRISNIGVIVSIEGGSVLTNARRGQGVYEKAIVTLKRLNEAGTITGISITITRFNYLYWMEQNKLDELIKLGVRIGIFIEYIPLTPNNGNLALPTCSSQAIDTCAFTRDNLEKLYNQFQSDDHGLILSPKERWGFRNYMLHCRETKPIYIVHSPGDEEYFGGCVSAGRGFAHVTPAGDLTPCPVSNIATHNLLKDSLRNGLKSPLFKKICEDEHLLETDGFPCALFAHPKEVDELAKSVGAYRTKIR
jgi:MoaA/NifB/PqqE/SkfB family radical SAM enzyme